MTNPIPLHRLLQSAYNTPVLVTPEKALVLTAVLSEQVMARGGYGGDDGAVSAQVFKAIENPDGSAEIFSPRASRFVGTVPVDAETGRPAPYAVTPEGVGIITTVGTCVNRGRWIGASSGIVTYEGIKHQCATIGRDVSVKSVIIDMECPGGAAVGAFDCARAIRDLAAIKPVYGFVNGLAASGGYALLSGCTRIISIPEGQTGSIGVYVMHVDFSAALAMEGIKVKFIYSGAHKIDGNPYEELRPDVLARYQTQIDVTREKFLECVAAGRGKRFDVEAARATEALIYDGAEAKKIGMIDDIGTFEDLLVDISSPASLSVTVVDDGEDDDGSNAKASDAVSMELTEEGAKALASLGLVTIN